MDDKFLENLIANHIAELFKARSRLSGADYFPEGSVGRSLGWGPLLELPYIGTKFWAGQEPPELRQQVVAALLAREHFRRENPNWGQIPLPLSSWDCEAFQYADDVRLNLLGYYGDSWRYSNWDDLHPSFPVLASGLMAYDSAPEDLRSDAALRREFPPRPLEGLCDGRLYWRSVPMIASDRELQAQNDAFDAREAAYKAELRAQNNLKEAAE